MNGIEFLTYLSRDIRLFTAKHLPYFTFKKLSISLVKVNKLYAQGGLIVCVILMDIEF